MRSAAAQTGTGSGRFNALWGRGGRRAGAIAATVVCALGAATVAAAAPGSRTGAPTPALAAFVQPALLSAIEQNPAQSFDVIVQSSDRSVTGAGLLEEAFLAGVATGQLRREFRSVDGDELMLTGRQILALARTKFVGAIVPNEAVTMSAVGLPQSNPQKWAWVTHAPVDWTNQALSLRAPTIAIVDSGIDANRADFGGRVIAQANFASSGADSPGDGFGHGTFVAGIAAGAADGMAGVAPSAKLVSLDVMNDEGTATVADVIAACDWILRNKNTYNIRVANFSLHAASRASIFFDPLDQAVEKLWLNGVVVVTASGNYATDGHESGVASAPGNDPFVITVGAADINDTLDTSDDVAAPWSAWGYTPDGFAKPELSAPGRYIIGPVQSGSGLTQERPESVVSSNTMQLSGTSFAAPVVAGAAAMILAAHPDWTPDQLKGALMASAQPTPAAAPRSLGVGELDVAAARALRSAPNPNAGLDRYVTTRRVRLAGSRHRRLAVGSARKRRLGRRRLGGRRVGGHRVGRHRVERWCLGLCRLGRRCLGRRCLGRRGLGRRSLGGRREGEPARTACNAHDERADRQGGAAARDRRCELRSDRRRLLLKKGPKNALSP